jgi:hypothetical protein
MKKFYVLLAALLIASASFAQVTLPKKVVKKDGTTLNIKGKPAKNNPQKATNSFWFNLIEDICNYLGEDASGFAPPIQCDTNGLYDFGDSGLSPVQFCSVGQVYDWSSNMWDELYNYTGAPQNVPYMITANSYSVDSIQTIYWYARGTNVDPSVVDTIAITYVVGFGDDDVRYLGSTNPNTGEFEPAFAMPLIPFDHNAFVPTYNSATTSGLSNTLDPASTTIIYDKIPLTTEDETIDPDDGSYTFYYLTLPTPEGLSNLTQKQMFVNITFIPGSARTPSSVIGTDLSTFRTALYDDLREGYQHTDYGSPELLNDYQMGFFHDADNFKANSSWYNIYQPNIFWGGNPKPTISLRVTCNDCETVNVNDPDMNKLTVYPNPATNNFTVNTGNDEKASIQLFNIVGQQVYSETFTGSTTVNVANLHSGVYMLKVNQNGKVNTTKVVVK